MHANVHININNNENKIQKSFPPLTMSMLHHFGRKLKVLET
jgi:hypothetical protein